ncbi:MAG: hypothetical protein AABW91_00855 [Nanoarchaeota archaeon]
MATLDDIKVKTTRRTDFHSEESQEEVEARKQGYLIERLYKAGCTIETIQDQYKTLYAKKPGLFGSQSVSGYESRLPRSGVKVNREATLDHVMGERL